MLLEDCIRRRVFAEYFGELVPLSHEMDRGAPRESEFFCAYFLVTRCNRYFAVYELVKSAMMDSETSSSSLNLGSIIFAGGMAGVAMWSIAIPPDVYSNASCFSSRLDYYLYR